MKNIIIVGSGAVAAELTLYINSQNEQADSKDLLNLIGYLEFKENVEKYWARYKLEKPVISDINSYSIQENDHFIVAIADISFKRKVLNILHERGASILNFIHHTSLIATTAKIGSGNIICPFCIIGPNAIVGNDNLITAYSYISHDCKVGDNNFFAAAGISGKVEIGNDNYFHTRSVVVPNISIGNNNVIQAGMVVDKDITHNSVVFHRFKEKVISVPKTSNDES